MLIGNCTAHLRSWKVSGMMFLDAAFLAILFYFLSATAGHVTQHLTHEIPNTNMWAARGSTGNANVLTTPIYHGPADTLSRALEKAGALPAKWNSHQTIQWLWKRLQEKMRSPVGEDCQQTMEYRLYFMSVQLKRFWVEKTVLEKLIQSF